MVKPRVLAWILLPGTLTTELAFYLASLLSGAEFRLPKSGEKADGKGGLGVASGGVPYLTPLLTGLMPVLACMALILVLVTRFGGAVFERFSLTQAAAPMNLPLLTSSTIWDVLIGQVHLLQGAWAAVTGVLADWPWNAPQAWLFQYLVVCLIVRMAPVRRPMRPVLFGTAVVAIVISLAVQILSVGGNWLYDIWPLLSYAWATALLLMALTLAVRGGVALTRIVMGKE
ncbi:MAG: hypothetical protein GX591_20115 [Planctomycetes bacterium]|nr:hypothetical protein [Planctomycetota bacterium]